MDTLQTRFLSAKKISRAIIRNVKDSQERRRLEEEHAHHIKNVMDYGFGFFPKHYIMDSIMWLEAPK